MDEDVIPPDYIIDPSLFEHLFFRRENYQDLRQIALDGHLGHLHNRFICWRIFLGLLPESQSLDEWVSATLKLRQDYQAIAVSHNVKST